MQQVDTIKKCCIQNQEDGTHDEHFLNDEYLQQRNTKNQLNARVEGLHMHCQRSSSSGQTQSAESIVGIYFTTIIRKVEIFPKRKPNNMQSARDLLNLEDLNWVDIFSDGWGTPLSSVRKYFEGEKYTCELCEKVYSKKKDWGEADMLAVAEKMMLEELEEEEDFEKAADESAAEVVTVLKTLERKNKEAAAATAGKSSGKKQD